MRMRKRRFYFRRNTARRALELKAVCSPIHKNKCGRETEFSLRGKQTEEAVIPSSTRFLNGSRFVVAVGTNAPGACRHSPAGVRAAAALGGSRGIARCLGCCVCPHGDRIAAGAEPRDPSPHASGSHGSCVPRLSSGAVRLAERQCAHLCLREMGRCRPAALPLGHTCLLLGFAFCLQCNGFVWLKV